MLIKMKSTEHMEILNDKLE